MVGNLTQAVDADESDCGVVGQCKLQVAVRVEVSCLLGSCNLGAVLTDQVDDVVVVLGEVADGDLCGGTTEIDVEPVGASAGDQRLVAAAGAEVVRAVATDCRIVDGGVWSGGLACAVGQEEVHAAIGEGTVQRLVAEAGEDMSDRIAGRAANGKRIFIAAVDRCTTGAGKDGIGHDQAGALFANECQGARAAEDRISTNAVQNGQLGRPTDDEVVASEARVAGLGGDDDSELSAAGHRVAAENPLTGHCGPHSIVQAVSSDEGMTIAEESEVAGRDRIIKDDVRRSVAAEHRGSTRAGVDRVAAFAASDGITAGGAAVIDVLTIHQGDVIVPTDCVVGDVTGSYQSVTAGGRAGDRRGDACKHGCVLTATTDGVGRRRAARRKNLIDGCCGGNIAQAAARSLDGRASRLHNGGACNGRGEGCHLIPKAFTFDAEDERSAACSGNCKT